MFRDLIDQVEAKHKYLTKADGSVRRDKAGRRISVNRHYQKPGKGRILGSGEGLNNWGRLRITDETNAELVIIAKRKGITKSELIRTYIEWGLENDT